MESDDRETGRDGDQDDNVVRFPKDWFGPIEDLVPVGSRAQAQTSDTQDSGRDDGFAVAGSDFWGEGAAALHEAVSAPGSGGRRPTETPVADEPPVETAEPSAGTAAPHGASRVPRRRRSRHPRARRPSLSLHGFSRPRRVAAGAAVGLVAIAAIVLAVLGTVDGRHRGSATLRHRPAVSFAADPLPLGQAGGDAGRAARIAMSSDLMRADSGTAARLQFAATRAITGARSATAGVTSTTRHVVAASDTAAADTTGASEPSSGSETPVDEAPTTTAPASTAPPATPSDPTSSSDGASAASDDASAGSGSTSKTYGYGGLLGAGHSGS